MNNKNKNSDENNSSELEDYCNKLIIQMNGIIKELAITNYQFSPEKIAQITQKTVVKFNELKGSQNKQ